MTQRTLAGLLALPLLIALWLVAATQPLDFVTYEPGLTVDVLDDPEGRETIQVEGRKTYRDDGQLRMTTVYVTRPRPAGSTNLFDLLGAWWSRDDAVYPYDAVYGEEETPESNREQGEIDMVSSQDAAIAVALTELGIDFEPAVEILDVTEGAPADDVFRAGDVVTAVDGRPVTAIEQVGKAVRATPVGQVLDVTVVRDGQEEQLSVTPELRDGEPFVGIRMLPGYDFPFEVSVEVSDDIGGPSAGLMFSLGIYDTLTPGSLTGGATVAGTGTLSPEGDVGPIGGIQQKIAAARETGASLFLVPPDNCAEALDADHGDTVLVRADTMHQARTAIEAWVADPGADLPTCEEVAE